MVGRVYVLLDRLADGAGAQDDGLGAAVELRGLRSHGADEREVVLAGGVGNADGPAGKAARGGVVGRVRVGGLEHVPVRQDVEVGGEDRGVGVGEDVERVGGGNLREEVVGVADQEEGLVEGELGVEEDLGDLGHAWV